MNTISKEFLLVFYCIILGLVMAIIDKILGIPSQGWAGVIHNASWMLAGGVYVVLRQHLYNN